MKAVGTKEKQTKWACIVRKGKVVKWKIGHWIRILAASFPSCVTYRVAYNFQFFKKYVSIDSESEGKGEEEIESSFGCLPNALYSESSAQPGRPDPESNH